MHQRFKRVSEYYAEFGRFDDAARRVAWRTRFDQELRFENLLEAVDWPTEGLSVLDVGCGLGHLVSYLEGTGRNARYVGVDVLPEMIEGARTRHPGFDFRVVDILGPSDLPRFDLVVCSGSLTVKVPNHEAFVLAMVERMLELSTGAVAVNFQSTRAFKANPLAAQDADLYHADPLDLYAKCRGLCRWSSLREDMLSSDMTVYLYRDYSLSLERYRSRMKSLDPVGLGWLYLERRIPAEALRLLEGVDTADAHNLCGVAHQQRGDRRSARQAYLRALAIDPNHEIARLNLSGLG